MVMGASPILRATSHLLALDELIRRALGVAGEIRRQAPAIELRFSTEDAFRCPIGDLLAIFRPLAASGLFDRFGLADTTGSAMPLQVHDTVRLIAAETGSAIEFHGHNDTGCAVANALTAQAAGATHLDATVLGIGERNGIAPLEGVIAGLYVQDPAAIRAKYDLPRIPELARLVAARIGIDVPFNHCIVGRTAFTHKAGIHTKAIINDPAVVVSRLGRGDQEMPATEPSSAMLRLFCRSSLLHGAQDLLGQVREEMLRRAVVRKS